MNINTQTCMDVINASDVSLWTLDGMTCLKSDKAGSILVCVTMDTGRPGFKLIPATKQLKVNGKYLGEKLFDGDKDLADAYSTKRNYLMTQKIAWCLAVLNNPGAWVNYNRLENPQPYEVFDANDVFFDIATFDAKNGPFVLRIGDNEEFQSQNFDVFVMKQFRALWKLARDKEQGE